MWKICTKCKRHKALYEYSNHKAQEFGLHLWCKDCESQAKKEYRKKQRQRKHITPEFKKCSKCGITKPSSEFHKDRIKKDGLNGRCKDCHNAKSRNKGEFVYLALSEDTRFLKIGYTGNIKRREGQFCQSHPGFNFKMINYITGDRALESCIHRSLKDYRAFDRYKEVYHSIDDVKPLLYSVGLL